MSQPRSRPSSEIFEAGEDETVDADWYEQNLQLAAELGKALLEKNRELESQLMQQQTLSQEQGLEIQYLKSQLDTMRTMTESRNRIYEEVDRNAQELEKSNQKYISESKTDKQKIEKQGSIITHLEEKVEQIQKKLDDANSKLVEKKQHKKAPEKRRTSSLNRLSLSDTKDQNSGFYFENLAWTCSDQFKNIPLNPYEIEIRKLQDVVQQSKIQQTIDRRKLEDLDVECSVLTDEKDSLENKIKILESKLSEAIMIQYELERRAVRSETPDIMSRMTSSGADIHFEIHEPESKLLQDVEHDETELRSEAKAVKLETGGSLYSSTESINKVATDAKEIQLGEDASLSILDELESQYQSLFTKYNAVIQAKNEGEDEARQRLAHKEVQTLLHITLNRDYYQDAAHVPPYKALFKDIFATLRKSRIEENLAETAIDADGSRRHTACSPIGDNDDDDEGGARGFVDGR